MLAIRRRIAEQVSNLPLISGTKDAIPFSLFSFFECRITILLLTYITLVPDPQALYPARMQLLGQLRTISGKDELKVENLLAKKQTN